MIFSPFPNSAGQILRELPDYYFGISYVKQGNGEYKSYDVLIDKKTLKASLFELTNDYYGGIPINGIIGSWGMFSSSLPAFKLMEEINKILKENKPDIDAKRKLQNILSQLHENNNDVMFVGRL